MLNSSQLSQKSLRTIALLLMLVGSAACTKEASDSGTNNNNSESTISSQTQISVTPATSEQCPGGGGVYTLYNDTNHNGIEDANEPPISQQVVCNGTNGTNGTNGSNALISSARVNVGLDACASGSGLQISFGLDTNNDGILEANEIMQTQVLCDGVNGQTGAQGPAGSNGYSIVFQSVAADPNVCPAGGVTTLMALDIYNTGSYSALDPDQSSMTICNGQNGLNGTNGTNAPVPAYEPVQPIMPCGDTVAYKEVLLLLSGGQVLASFSDDVAGDDTRLTLLPDGSYTDTDSSNCEFSIQTSADGTTRSISWLGAVQETWPLTN